MIDALHRRHTWRHDEVVVVEGLRAERQRCPHCDATRLRAAQTDAPAEQDEGVTDRLVRGDRR